MTLFVVSICPGTIKEHRSWATQPTNSFRSLKCRVARDLTYALATRKCLPELYYFIAGWNDAAIRNKAYDTLEVLYWQNLSYRLGKLLGPASRDVQIAMYDLCVRQQQEKLAGAADAGS
jgi:hypothetical protein